MEEKTNGAPRDGVPSPPPAARLRPSSFLQTLRSYSHPPTLSMSHAPSPEPPGAPAPGMGGIGAGGGSRRHVHDSLRPPLFRPSSIIPPKQANDEYGGDTTLPQADRLAAFRRLIGIDSAPTHTVDGSYHRPAENVGLYTHVVHEEIQCRIKYKRFSWIINASLGLQIIVAAALTALGAGDGPRSAVTVFGAINTVLAGVLTFLKGSGLPNREKYYASEWARIREHIEQREREFGLEGCPLDVHREVTLIQMMYNDIKQDVEASTPDGYASVAQAKKIAAGMGLSFGAASGHGSQPGAHNDANGAPPNGGVPSGRFSQTFGPGAYERRDGTATADGRDSTMAASRLEDGTLLSSKAHDSAAGWNEIPVGRVPARNSEPPGLVPPPTTSPIPFQQHQQPQQLQYQQQQQPQYQQQQPQYQQQQPQYQQQQQQHQHGSVHSDSFLGRIADRFVHDNSSGGRGSGLGHVFETVERLRTKYGDDLLERLRGLEHGAEQRTRSAGESVQQEADNLTNAALDTATTTATAAAGTAAAAAAAARHAADDAQAAVSRDAHRLADAGAQAERAGREAVMHEAGTVTQAAARADASAHHALASEAARVADAGRQVERAGHDIARSFFSAQPRPGPGPGPGAREGEDNQRWYY